MTHWYLGPYGGDLSKLLNILKWELNSFWGKITFFQSVIANFLVYIEPSKYVVKFVSDSGKFQKRFLGGGLVKRAMSPIGHGSCVIYDLGWSVGGCVKSLALSGS